MSDTGALPSAIEIIPGMVAGSVAVPPSKSYTNRALLLAALAHGVSTVRNPLRSDDAEAMTEALRALGVRIEDHGDTLTVYGTGGAFLKPAAPINCRDSGTTIRFLTAVAAQCNFPVTLTGSPQLQRRPLGPLLDALTGLGVDVTTERDDGCPPVTVRGPFRRFSACVDAHKSSQYASALLMALGANGGANASLTVTNMVSEPYVNMTLASMHAFGAEWEPHPDRVHVYRPTALTRYTAAETTVEYDASAAGHLFGIAAVAGGSVTVSNAIPTKQPDALLPAFLAMMGCVMRDASPGLSVARDAFLHAEPLIPMGDWPDMLPVMTVVAAFANGTTTITDVAHARGHETDRITAVATELGKMGVAVEERDDGLVIKGGGAHGARINTYGDHRMAMAFAAAGAAIPGIIIENPACVRKTYPGFWDDLRSLGVDWRAA